jgi:hypothetical protein
MRNSIIVLFTIYYLDDNEGKYNTYAEGENEYTILMGNHYVKKPVVRD